MNKISQVDAGGFHLENGLPDEYYAFSGGEISMTVERCGGINTLQVLDIHEHKGKLYPDRCPSPPVILREGNRCGKRPLYGPGMQFISTQKLEDGRPGRNLFHFPDNTELYPFGFRSESEKFGYRLGYDMCIQGRSVLFRLSNAFPQRDKLLISLNKDHMISGEMGSMKNQIVGLVWDTEAFKTPDFDKNKPFPDSGKMTLTWDFIGLDKALGAFVMEGVMSFAYGKKPIAVVLAASRPMTIEKTATRYLLRIPWDKSSSMDEISFCIVLSANRAKGHAAAVKANAKFDKIMRDRIEKSVSYSRQAPALDIEALPSAAEFARTIPAFEQAMLLAETDKEACIRAAMHKFGFFAMWDQIYPTKAFLLMGDFETAKKLLRYLIFMPNSEPVFWNTLHLIITAEEAIACSGDKKFLDEIYANLKSFFLWACKNADAKTGMIPYPCSSGVDDPAEIGIEGLVWPSCLNGWWYNACRAMENFALLKKDKKLTAAAQAMGAKVEKNYLPVFFDPKHGYLHAVIDPKNRKGTGVYQNVSTLGMDYPYGEFLLRQRIREIAEYQAFQLCHPAGRSAVSYFDKASEMWKNVIMFQHLAHEAKVARAAGFGDETVRLAKTYLGIFDRTKVGIETHNITGCEGDISQLANWQAFGARAAYGALVEGVVGIQWDIGGFQYAPCDVEGYATIKEYRFKNSRWDIEVSGKGPFVRRFTVDGFPLRGTMRLPIDFLEDGKFHKLEIIRSEKPFCEPTLLSAVGAAITDVQSSPSKLSFVIRNAAHASIKLWAPSRPTVKLGTRKIEIEWDEKKNICWCDTVFSAGDKMEFSL